MKGLWKDKWQAESFPLNCRHHSKRHHNTTTRRDLVFIFAQQIDGNKGMVGVRRIKAKERKEDAAPQRRMALKCLSLLKSTPKLCPRNALALSRLFFLFPLPGKTQDATMWRKNKDGWKRKKRPHTRTNLRCRQHIDQAEKTLQPPEALPAIG